MTAVARVEKIGAALDLLDRAAKAPRGFFLQREDALAIREVIDWLRVDSEKKDQRIDALEEVARKARKFGITEGD